MRFKTYTWIIIIVVVTLTTAIMTYLIKLKITMHKLSQSGASFIKQKEGLRLQAYQCSANVWTIGYGHTKGVTPNMIITAAQADDLFKSDIAVFEGGVNNLMLAVNQKQFDALVSLAFNIGLSALRNSTLVKLIRKDPMDPAIKKEWLKWDHAGGAVVPGLTARRQQEVNMYFA